MTPVLVALWANSSHRWASPMGTGLSSCRGIFPVPLRAPGGPCSSRTQLTLVLLSLLELSHSFPANPFYCCPAFGLPLSSAPARTPFIYSLAIVMTDLSDTSTNTIVTEEQVCRNKCVSWNDDKRSWQEVRVGGTPTYQHSHTQG